MGFNFGIAFGAAANAGVNTYTKLQEEKRQQEEFAWKAKEQADKVNLANAYSETYGAGDTKNQQAFNAEATKALDEQGGGPVVDNKAVPYALKDKQKDFERIAAQYKIDPTKIQQASLGNYQLNKARLDDDRESKIKDIQDQTAEAYKTLAGFHDSKDVPGMLKTFGPQYEELTGHKVIMGTSGAVTVQNKDGKSIATYKDADSLAKSLGREIQNYADMQIGNLDRNYGVAVRGVKVKEATVDSENAKNWASANASNAYGGYMSANTKNLTDKNARENDVFSTAKFYSEQIQALDPKDPQYEQKKFDLAQKGESAVALKSGDFSKVAANTPLGQAYTSYNKSVEAASKNGAEAPSLPDHMGKQGFAVGPIEATYKQKVAALVAQGKDKEAKDVVSQYNKQFYRTPMELPTVKPVAVPDAKPSAIKVDQAPASTPYYTAKGAIEKDIKNLQDRIENETSSVKRSNLTLELKRKEAELKRSK